MESKKSYIPVKVFVSYLVLAALVVGASLMLYSENVFFSETENKITSENRKMLKITTLLSDIYETESLARITIQSNDAADFRNYTRQTDSLVTQIDSLKLLIKSDYQVMLLDSVKILLSRKTANIGQLKEIKSRASDEVKVKNAINSLTRMELSLRKLRLEDFVKNPADLGAYQRDVLKRYVEYLNQNIPDDNTNTLSQSALDSMLVASKMLLNDVKRETAKRNELLNSEEKKLLQNELSISAQLRKISNIIEREIIINTTKNNQEKESTLKNIIRIVTITAAIGILLTLLFSLLILNDFSKTQSYKKQLEAANLRAKSLLRNREQLISTVSHDLKTPLSTIVGYTELLGNANLDTKQSYYNKNIKGASEYISHLIQDLLDFTQIEAGKIVVENIAFPLQDVINDVASGIQSVHQQKPIALSITIEKRLDHRIMGDPFRLRQVLTNIIGNAYKFTASGFIKIDAAIDSESLNVVIRIEDSGIGIAKDNQELIFEEFTQADHSIEKKYGGTGLGLTISKKMIEILGGSLTLESDFGKGSLFTITLPLQFDQSGPVPGSTPTGKNLTAIVVDDDPNLLQLTAEILKQQQHNVLTFTDANAALEKMKTTPFDFIITDIQMPEIDGFAFLEQLKKMANYVRQPVIAITGKADSSLKTYEDAGFSAVVKKPYSPKAMLTVLGNILKNQSLPVDILAENTPPDFQDHYSLESLQSFIPNDPKALKEVLSSFMAGTAENLKAMEQAIAQQNNTEIKRIAHKMYPMFLQIKANEIGRMLENLEQENHSIEETMQLFDTVTEKIDALFLIIEKQLII